MLAQSKALSPIKKFFRYYQVCRLHSMRKKLALEIETQSNFVGQVKKLHEREVKQLDDLIQQQKELNNGNR